MPLSINTNIASMTAQRSFLNSNASLEQSFERLSSGKRVNSAVDDAAGLAIGKDLESRVSGLNQAIRNVNDGISMVQITEGTLDEVTSILQRMRDLAVQASSGSLSSTERGYLDSEHSKLATTLGSVLDQAQFNGTDLVDDSSAGSFVIQAGADATETTTINVSAMTETTLGVAASQIDMNGYEQVTITGVTAARVAAEIATTESIFVTVNGTAVDITGDVSATASTTQHIVDGLNASSNASVSALSWSTSTDGTIVGTYDAAGHVSNGTYKIEFKGLNPDETFTGTVTREAYGITAIDAALATVASERATLGATQSQLESTVRNLANVAENTAAAAGRIMDTDYAAETANLTKAQILQQAATSILAQANAQPQAVLSLLQ